MTLYVINERDLDDLEVAHDALLDMRSWEAIDTARYLIAQVLDRVKDLPEDNLFFSAYWEN